MQFSDRIQMENHPFHPYKPNGSTSCVIPLTLVELELYSKCPQWDAIFRPYTNRKQSFTDCQKVPIEKLFYRTVSVYWTTSRRSRGSNPVEALIFFRLLLSNCLNWKINCDDHSSLSFSIRHRKRRKKSINKALLKNTNWFLKLLTG